MSCTTRALLILLLPSMVLAAEEKSTGLPKFSPFEQRGAATAAPAANETIEFAGVSSIGQKTDLIFYDKTAKKSHWIAKGETKEGITVLNYDERRDIAVVKYNGVEKTLTLRKGAGPTGAVRTAVNASGFNVSTATPLAAPVPVQVPIPADVAAANGMATTTAAPTTTPMVPLPPAPPAGSPAEVQARQETEARMLVSDLLEIGMAQRRAYEEAQRKAAEGNPANSTTGNPPPSTMAQPAQPVR